MTRINKGICKGMVLIGLLIPIPGMLAQQDKVDMEQILEVYRHPAVITLDEMPGW